MPGTGQSAWKLAPESDRVYDRAAEYLKKRGDVDGDRIGVLMVSFGGYYAVRLALTRPWVKAAVNVGGPVSLSFTRQQAEKVPEVMVRTIAHAMGVDKTLPLDEMVKKIEPFSLDSLMENPPFRAPLLSINGKEDPLVPIGDLYVISDYGIDQEKLVFEDDGHCAMNHLEEWANKAAIWLKEKLENNM
jgi:esterase FrsA